MKKKGTRRYISRRCYSGYAMPQKMLSPIVWFGDTHIWEVVKNDSPAVPINENRFAWWFWKMPSLFSLSLQFTQPHFYCFTRICRPSFRFFIAFWEHFDLCFRFCRSSFTFHHFCFAFLEPLFLYFLYFRCLLFLTTLAFLKTEVLKIEHCICWRPFCKLAWKHFYGAAEQNISSLSVFRSQICFQIHRLICA